MDRAKRKAHTKTEDSTAIRYGKSFNQFCEFKKQIEKEDAVLIIAENYVVMSVNHYKEIIKQNSNLKNP